MNTKTKAEQKLRNIVHLRLLKFRNEPLTGSLKRDIEAELHSLTWELSEYDLKLNFDVSIDKKRVL